VLGQADYTHNSQGGLQRGMYNPYGVCVDTSGCVWVADTVNNRVLKFNPPFSNNMNASLALGQINYTSGVPGFSSRRHE
jgi:DNA-binding beta-propeller fold protein YncE